MSGFSGAAELELSKAAGGISHLQKPIEIADVEALLAPRRLSQTIASERGFRAERMTGQNFARADLAPAAATVF